MGASGILRPDEVIFYHPLDDFTEYTQDQIWNGCGEFVGGKIGSGCSHIVPNVFTWSLPVEVYDDVVYSDGGWGTSDIIALDETTVVCAYKPYGTFDVEAKVGIVSGTTVVFGSGFLKTGCGVQFSIAKLDATRFAIASRDASLTYAVGVVIGEVSGTNITWGTQAVAPLISGEQSVYGNDIKGVICPTPSSIVISRAAYGPVYWSAQVIAGEVDGTVVTLGSGTIARAKYGQACRTSLTAFDSSTVLLGVIDSYYSNYDLETYVCTISGTDITSYPDTGPSYDGGKFPSPHGLVSLSSTKVVAFTGPIIYASVGIRSDTDIAWGSRYSIDTSQPFQEGFGVSKLDSTHIIVSYRPYSSLRVEAKVITISGTNITVGAASICVDELRHSNQITSLSSTKVATINIPITHGICNTIIGEIPLKTEITSSVPSEYSSTSGTTRFVVAFWAINPTIDGTIIEIERGYEVILTSGTVSLGGTTAEWDVSLGLDDDDDHLIVLDFEHQSSTTWNLSASIDGAAFTDYGSQDVGSQIVVTEDTAPRFAISGTSEETQWIDELVVWAGDKNTFDQFTGQELINLYHLADTFGLSMNNYASLGQINVSGSLFISGHDLISVSGNLFMLGPQIVGSSGNVDLYIKNYISTQISGTLFINGLGSFITSLDQGPPRTYGWGYNAFGQCDPPFDINFTAIAAGGYFGLGVKLDGSIVGWGYNDCGQLNIPSPNSNFIKVAGGRSHSLGLKSDGTLVAWGRNSPYGQCNIPSPNANWSGIDGGFYHSLGLKTDGSIQAWGRNIEGQSNEPSPNTDFVDIAAGDYHNLGLKSDGSIVAWGSNSDGQTSVPSPNADFVDISAGVGHSIGLKSDGTIVAWGRNDKGQINVPTDISDFIAVVAGGHFGLGLRSNGLVVHWGDDTYNQDGMPVDNFVEMSAGFAHALGLAPDIMGKLFISGPLPMAASGNLFITSYNTIDASGNLFIAGPTLAAASGDLFICSVGINSDTIDLFIEHLEITTDICDLFIHGRETITNICSLSTFAPPPDIFNISNLYCHGHINFNDLSSLYTYGNEAATDVCALSVIGNDKDINSCAFFVHGHETTNNEYTLFIYGNESSNASSDIFINGCCKCSSSAPLFTFGPPPDIFNVRNLYVNGHIGFNTLGYLYISGHDAITASENLYIYGKNSYAISNDLFISAPGPVSGSNDLFVKGSISGIVGQPIDWLLQTHDYYPQIIGILQGAISATIQLWEITDGQNILVSVTSDNCYQIGNTGRWAWSTANLPIYTTRQRQYLYVMTADDSATFTGQFFLELPERAKWIHPNDCKDYLI